jgi:hypothetical protein
LNIHLKANFNTFGMKMTKLCQELQRDQGKRIQGKKKLLITSSLDNNMSRRDQARERLGNELGRNIVKIFHAKSKLEVLYSLERNRPPRLCKDLARSLGKRIIIGRKLRITHIIARNRK